MAWNSTGSFRFDALPPEMAEMILKRAEDSSDILNMFEVFPSWIGQIMKKRQEWLMDQVAPLIFRWLDKKEVLNCRLVCWRWSRGIDKFLENCQLDLPREASRAQIKLNFKLFRFNVHNRCYPYNWIKFRELATKMENRPLDRNPFIGRKINFDYGNKFRGIPGRMFVWREAVTFVREFGAHIWHFELHRFWGRFPDNAKSQIIIPILSLLPNLKRLDIYLADDKRLTEAEVEQFQSTVHLPHLEALSLYPYFSTPLIHLIIQRFSQQITRLEIGYSTWREDYSQIFPNLTELKLMGNDVYVADARKVLASLNSPNLLRLELDWLRMSAETVDQLNGSIFSLLQPFGKLISFKVHFNFPLRSVMALEEMVGPVFSTPVFITSLKSLSVVIENWKLCELVNFEFFKGFPNLSYIDVNSRCGKRAMDSPTINPYEPSIWEVGLPKLLELNLRKDFCQYKCLSRAEYEWRAKGGM